MVDIITTLYGLRIGLYEVNKIILFFMDNLGNDKGIATAMIMKIGIVMLSYIVYNYTDKGIDKIKERIYLYNALNGIIVLSFTISAIILFNAVTINIALIIWKLL